MSKTEMLPELPSADAGTHIPRSPDAWMRSGEYLPPFMRDFHDQKDLFKALQEVVERRNAKDNSYTEGLTWVAAHVYTVDVFLWVLAKHGYTLQRSRKRVRFGDLGDFVGEAMARWRGQSALALREALGAARDMGSRVAAQVADDAPGNTPNPTSKGHHP